MIAHIVFFTPKGDVSDADRRSFALCLQATFRTVDAISRAFLGRALDIDPGYARHFGDKTYEFAAVLEFTDREALVKYLTHPAHDELGRLFWLYCEATIILEVECADARSDEALALIMGEGK
jgi:hypothetical protein